jgi:DNA-binding ferritin-like protein (Dps family)
MSSGSNREKLVDHNNPKVRIKGQRGSHQNSLRFELYTEGFRRIDRGLSDGNYFEVISLADSIITDRLNSLVQHVRHGEETDFPHQSVGGMVQILMKEVKERKFPLPKDIKTIINKTNDNWVPKRNFCVHSFVVVTHSNQDKSLQDRLGLLEQCAVEGADLSRLITNKIDNFIKKTFHNKNN